MRHLLSNRSVAILPALLLLVLAGCRVQVIPSNSVESGVSINNKTPTEPELPNPCSPEMVSQRTVLMGQGTPAAPYEIATLNDLKEMSVRVNADNANFGNKHYLQICDIDASVTETDGGFTPIGTDMINEGTITFTGVYDGNGKVIRNLHIRNDTVDTREIALFGYLGRGGRVARVGLLNADIRGYSSVAPLVGNNYGYVISSYATGTVTQLHQETFRCGDTGGLVGSNYGIVLHSFARTDLKGNFADCYDVGGLVGDLSGGLIGYSYSTGLAPADQGMIGWSSSNRPGPHASYWDTELSGTAVSAGGVGKTSAEMKTKATFSDWDFDTIWDIHPDNNEGYPHLKNLISDLPSLSGSGTPEDPLLLSSPEDLSIWMIRFAGGEYRGKTLKLQRDISFSAFTGILFPPGADWSDPFDGTLDGNNKTISDLNLNFPDMERFGLIAATSAEAVVKNLTVQGQVTGKNTVGLLIGDNAGIVENCTVSGTLIAIDNVAGLLVGSNSGTIRQSFSSGMVNATAGNIGGLVGGNGGTIIDSSSSATVTGLDGVGGMVGVNSGSLIRSSASGSVTGRNSVGGLVGHSEASLVSDSHAAGNVTAVSSVGGLVGSGNSVTVETSWSSGSVSAADGTGTDFGGLIGTASSSNITSSRSSGVVTGNDQTGGLAGELAGSSVTGSESTSNVIGHDRVGGLVGHTNNLTLTSSKAAGTVTGNLAVGGLIGYSDWGSADDCYARGSVTGAVDVAGLIGHSHFGWVRRCYAAGPVTGGGGSGGLTNNASATSAGDNFWDIETTGQTSTFIIGEGKTSAEMKTQATFVNWDFADVWKIAPGEYPRLKWEP